MDLIGRRSYSPVECPASVYFDDFLVLPLRVYVWLGHCEVLQLVLKLEQSSQYGRVCLLFYASMTTMVDNSV